MLLVDPTKEYIFSYNFRTQGSFNGIIQEIPDVSVDNFERTDSRAYFLSHCHTDHTQGLFSEVFLAHLKRKKVFVYMSEGSAAIVKHESPNKDIEDYIRPLEIGDQNTVTIPADEENNTEELYITVSLLPAGHCFGSVMFLFKTLYKTILYTGDFRISANSVSKYAQLHENGEIIKLDALYVDTTFQNDEHDDFPKRSDSVDVVIRHIKKWLRENDRNEVALHTSANYGYEFVYKKIFQNIGEKVYVDDKSWALYSQFPRTVPGVTNDSNSRIHRCRNRHESQAHDRCFPNTKQENSKKPSYLYIHFSAYKWREYTPDDSMIEIKNIPNKYRIDVCFATHCSKSELEYFVNYLAPKRVVGFPNEYNRNVKENIPRKRRNSEEFSTIVKVPRLLDKELVMQMFAD